MLFLAYLPRESDPIERANMSLCMAQRLPISEHKYIMYTYLSHTSQNLFNIYISPGICSCKTGFIAY